ncbi:type IV pilus biogenesis protein PilP [Fundidesulfovibrio putealis]|uniref:type IV pilus biogenesis protein PilP n=1 Tax=Fundidesulfovibrio putealis TaxID=270496 RepID=UPI000484CCB9|nr:type IV pilus biogenesis protein PilP [Fundidesulfovibrio putealis]KAF0234902.1 MAG: Type IV pilus bioproteinis [Desulfovibrionaceae bacterium]
MLLGEGRNKRKIIMWIGALALVVPSLWMIVGEVRQSFSPPAPPIKAGASAPSSPGVKTSSAPASAPKAEAPGAATVAPSLQAGAPSVTVPVAGNLKELTRLRAELEEARLQASIAQEREKGAPKAAAAPVVIAPPPAVTSPVHKEAQTGPVVESVQGADGRLTARVRLGSGKVVGVRPGDRLADGVVEAVGRDGVSIRKGRSLTMIGFE